MKAKDKAIELVDKFNEHIEMVSDYRYELGFAKNRALKCVDEIEKHFEFMYGQDKDSTMYLIEVKQEINKL